MDTRSKKYFELAKELSKKSDHHSHHIGCVIVKRNKIYSVGWNKLKTHPKSNHPFYSLHAELHAIINLDKRHSGSLEIYLYRETKAGVPAISRPCRTCQAALKEIGIKKVHYSNQGSYTSEEI
jgi:deoxycytidylate deaminase